MPVKEEDGIECLILGCRRNVPRDRLMYQVRLDLRQSQVLRMSLVVEQDLAPDPTQVGFFGADTVVFETKDVPHLIQQLLGLRFLGTDIVWQFALHRHRSSCILADRVTFAS